ncbi:shu, partial [Drosophila busckii]
VSENILKRILRSGQMILGKVPANANAHYLIAEGRELIRSKKPRVYRTGNGFKLNQFEVLLRSMYPKERAIFYKKKPQPQGKPLLVMIFTIEVLRYEVISMPQPKKPIQSTSFDKVFSLAQIQYMRGKRHMQGANYCHAVAFFEIGITELHYCSLGSDLERHKQVTLLIHLYTNSMICCNKLNIPQRVCIMMQAMRGFSEDKIPWEALIHEGRALTSMGYYDQARTAIMSALNKDPQNQHIIDEMIKLNRVVGVGVEKEIKLDVEKEKAENVLRFKQLYGTVFSEFVATSDISFKMRIECSKEQHEMLQVLANEHNLKLAHSAIDEATVIVSKKLKNKYV